MVDKLKESEKLSEVVDFLNDIKDWSHKSRSGFEIDTINRTQKMNVESLYYLAQKIIERKICNLSLKNRNEIYFENGLSLEQTNEENTKNVRVEGSFENALRSIDKLMLDDMVFYFPKWVKNHPDYKKDNKVRVPILNIKSVIDADEKMNKKMSERIITGKAVKGESAYHVLNQLTYLKQIRNAHIFGELLEPNINEINEIMGATLRNMSEDTQNGFTQELYDSFTSTSGFYNVLEILVEDAAYQKNSDLCEVYMKRLGNLIKTSSKDEGEKGFIMINVATSIGNLGESLSIINLDKIFINYLKNLKNYKDVEDSAVKFEETENGEISTILVDYSSLKYGYTLFDLKCELSEEEKRVLTYTNLLYEGYHEKILSGRNMFERNFIKNLGKTIIGLNSVLDKKIDKYRAYGPDGDVTYRENACMHLRLTNINKEDSDFLKKIMNKLLLVDNLMYEKELIPLVDEYLMEKELNKNNARLDINKKTKGLKF